MLTRRRFLAFSALAVPGFAYASPKQWNALPAMLAALKKQNGGRLGVCVIDTATGQRGGYRQNERFAMCSTFKFLLVADVLQRIDRHEEKLHRAIAIPGKPLVSNSPLTEPRAGSTMTVAELCHAAITRSDNTAANLLLDITGGPPGLTTFCRSIGDNITRLDRNETSLNEAKSGDPRDTTSPAAMADDLNRVLLGTVLSPDSRQQLTAWMEANETGLDKLRKNLPAGWRAADKTGNNGENTMNDIAVLWQPSGKPILVTAYITECAGPDRKRVAMLAQIGSLVSGR